MEKKPEPELTSTIHFGAREGAKPTASTQNVENVSRLNDEERDIIAKLSAKVGMLIMHRGPGKGSRFLITEAAAIGRSTENEIFLDDVTVSRKHAVIAYSQSGGFSMKDLGSLNGTYVNGQPVVEVSLTSGDEIQIGKFHMLFFGGKS